MTCSKFHVNAVVCFVLNTCCLWKLWAVDNDEHVVHSKFIVFQRSLLSTSYSKNPGNPAKFCFVFMKAESVCCLFQK